MHKTGSGRLEEETKKLFNAYLTANPHLSVQKIRGTGLEDLHVVERLAERTFWCMTLKFRTVELLDNLLNVLCDNSIPQQLFLDITTISVMLLSSNLQRHMLKCEELVKNIYPKSVYQLEETLSVKLRAFDIEVADGDTLFNNFEVLTSNQFV